MNSAKKIKILITGAKGQLCREIEKQLAKKYQLILTNLDSMDITDKFKVYKIIKQEQPDYIIHGAAYTQVDMAEENRVLCQKINGLGTKNIAQAAVKNNTILIYISSDYVFDGHKNKPYAESDQTKPLSVYGQTKLIGEKYIGKICKKYYIVRSSWIFGEGKNFIDTMLKLAQTKKRIEVVSDQIGSPTYTKDLVLALEKMIKIKPAYGVYHFSGKGECSWHVFSKEIFKQKKINIELNPIQSISYPQKAQRPTYSYLDKTKIEKALKIKIRSWQSMLKEYLGQRT